MTTDTRSAPKEWRGRFFEDIEVGGTEHERDDALGRGGLVGEPYALGGLDDCDDRRPFGPEGGDRLRRRLREDDRLELHARHGVDVVHEELGVGAVDADHAPRAVAGRREEVGQQVPRAALLGRDNRVLEVGDDCVGLRRERALELPGVRARREEQGPDVGERCCRHKMWLYVGHSGAVKHLP